MKIYYFDSSALVKRYHYEKGTTAVDEILDDLEVDHDARLIDGPLEFDRHRVRVSV